jgi:hypothetical protein
VIFAEPLIIFYRSFGSPVLETTTIFNCKKRCDSQSFRVLGAIMKLALIGAIAVACFSVAPAMASTVTFDATLDLSQPGVLTNTQIHAYNGGESAFSPIVPQQVAVGDQFTLNYDFGGTGVSADNITFAWASVDAQFTDPNEDVDEAGTFSFLNKDGSTLLSLTFGSDTEGSRHIGQGSQFFNTGAIVFYGVSYSGTLTGASPSDARTYNQPALWVDGTNLHALTAVTPVPAALPLFISALGGLGFVGWRRKRADAA